MGRAGGVGAVGNAALRSPVRCRYKASCLIRFAWPVSGFFTSLYFARAVATLLRNVSTLIVVGSLTIFSPGQIKVSRVCAVSVMVLSQLSSSLSMATTEAVPSDKYISTMAISQLSSSIFYDG